MSDEKLMSIIQKLLMQILSLIGAIGKHTFAKRKFMSAYSKLMNA